MTLSALWNMCTTISERWVFKLYTEEEQEQEQEEEKK
jgi:hypothetical protein